MATHTPGGPERRTSRGGFGSEGMAFCAVVSFKSERGKKKMHCLIYFKASKLLQTAML